MYNPLKYVPSVAIRLKRCDRNSPEFSRIIKRLIKNKAFMHVLSESIAASDEPIIIDERSGMLSDSAMAKLFVRIDIFCSMAALATALELFGEALSAYSKYFFAAAIVTFPFYFYSANKAGARICKCVEHFIDTYTIPDARFTAERINRAVAAQCSSTDVIELSDLNSGIRCGCYSCLSQFPSSEMHDMGHLGDYKCPSCGKTTVISERCGYDVTDELLEDLHEYWLN